jgi:serine/threonine-protein kinase
MNAGQLIAGKYRLNRLLGMGGMASVWSATNIYTEREFAIKFMLPQAARTPEAAQRFLIEARVSARIDHPNIIEVIDLGQAEDGTLFLVMELLSGAPLDVLLRQSDPAIRLRDFLHIMRDVAEALAAAHKTGVIHRDLKPSNVFLHTDRDGQVVPKVLDFGVSKILEEGANAALTVVGTILGSPLYMSPEQALGTEGVDGRTDVFAFGAILFEGLCGQRAYTAPNVNALIVAIATTAPRPIEELAPDLPASLNSLVRDCMAKDKEQRLASFEPVVERLDAVLVELHDSGLRLPSHQASLFSSDSLPEVSLYGSRERPASAQGTSMAPHSLPTPDAPRAEAVDDSLHRAGSAGSERTRRMAGGAAVIASTLGIILGTAFVRSTGRFASVHGADGRVAAAASPAPGGSTAPTPTVPVIPIDSLPAAGHESAAARATGRLWITATPGWCSASVDGVARGVTPVAGLSLTPGAHKVDCVAPNGTLRTATVSVVDGAEAHQRFSLSD